MGLKRFTKPTFLKKIRRELLQKLFGQYAEVMKAQGIVLPSPDSKDADFFHDLAHLAQNSDALPSDLVDVLYSIEEMSNEHGHERLMLLVNQQNLEVPSNSTHEDVAVQVWLKDPARFTEKHSEFKLCRLTGFQCYANRESKDQTATFKSPASDVLERLEGDLDRWCFKYYGGDKTAVIEVFQMDGEYWFMLSHGDAAARISSVKPGQRNRAILNFRPNKDDVVVYSPARDEIRILARTKRKIDLYKSSFGLRLFADEEYFSERRAYTLDPLMNDGEDSLNVADVPGILGITLVEVKFVVGGTFGVVEIRKASDLFKALESGEVSRFPQRGNLARAVFEVMFEGAKTHRRVSVTPPNGLSLGRFCDALAVERWLAKRGFRPSMKQNQGA